MDSKILHFFEMKDYQNIIKLYEESIMMNNNIKFKELSSQTIYAIIFSLLKSNKYDDIEFLILRLKKENVFDFSYVFLVLCSYLKQLSIFKALSLIAEIDILKTENILKLLEEDETSILEDDEFSYINMLKCKDIDKIPCLLIYVLISSLDNNKVKNINDVMINYYEMLDIIYQSSADYQIIEYMMNISKLLLN